VTGDTDPPGVPVADGGESADGSNPVPLRVRGIYTTALTRLLLDAGHEVVAASPPIRRRFDESFRVAPHAVAVETTPDRQGVGIHGDHDGVAAVRDLLVDVAIDALSWDDPLPAGAVRVGRVTETLGGGAVVACGGADGDDGGGGTDGDAAGYLPYDAADGYVDDGDRVVVQVREPAAPWDDDRPTLDGTLHAERGLATLVRGRSETRVTGGDDAAARELAGMTDLLDPDVPDGWGIEWSRDATDAGLDALGDSLARAGDRARTIDDALADAGVNGEADGPTHEVGDLVTPATSAWVWFGREARFALDDRRRAVTTTMPGHHRTKAASRAASSGVDLAEALCEFDGAGDGNGTTAATAANGSGDLDFPFAVVTDQFGPTEGDSLRIDHGKPAGHLVTLGTGEVTTRDPDGTVAVRREMSAGGTYDALGNPREAGDTALTKFREGRWWYPTVYRSADGERKGTYVNVCTPVELFPDAVRYVDLHVDVVKHADGTVERVDDDELDAAVEKGLLREDVADKARSVATAVERALDGE
jgi:hypothetical protein